MNYVYFLKASRSVFAVSRRVTGFHQFVFHGTGEFPGHEYGDGWVGPTASNEVRELMHISRSGAVVPDIFSPRGSDFVVSPAVRARLKGLSGIQFHPVVFDHVVDLAMPPLGSWPSDRSVQKAAANTYYAPSRKSEKRDAFRRELMKRPDVASLRSQFDGYSQLLPGTLVEVFVVNDWKQFEVSWGSYRVYVSGRERVWLSHSILERYEIYDAGGCVHVLSEDAFTAIAPFLNLDYYDVAVLDLRPD